MPPPVAVRVIRCLPTATLEPILIVAMEDPEPGAGMVPGLKVTMDGPVKVIAELKPPEIAVVRVVVPD